MYVGRIVAVAKTSGGHNTALYRVSSRSFPNRQAVNLGGTIVVVPREGAEGDVRMNPYVTYNAIRTTDEWAIATNGTHTDPITEKISSGMSVRDALVMSLLALDYEHDALETPRIAAVVPLLGDTAWLAIVRADALVVKQVAIAAGRATYLATYEANDVRSDQVSVFDASSADLAARATISMGAFATMEHPVAAAAALAGADGFTLGTHLVP